MNKIQSPYDEVILPTEDGGYVWKRYNTRGELLQKKKYLFYKLAEVRRIHREAMFVRVQAIGR